MSKEKENKQTGTPEELTRNPSEEQSLSIPVIEEEVKIGKQVIERGKITLTKEVHEEEETLELPETHEEIEIERVPINKYVGSDAPQVRQEGNTTIYPVLKEVPVVVKRLMVVEEVRVTKHVRKTTSTEKVSLRKEEVKVNREKSDSAK